MRAGRLRKRVIIQYQTIAEGTHGNVDVTWNDEDTVWASIEPVSAKEYFASGQIQSEITHKIIMRYRRNMTTDKRIKYGNRYYDITQIINTREENRELVLMCKEKVV